MVTIVSAEYWVTFHRKMIQQIFNIFKQIKLSNFMRQWKLEMNMLESFYMSWNLFTKNKF